MSLPSWAIPKDWIRLTDKVRSYCDASRPCSLTQQKNKKKYKIIFKHELKKNMRWLKQVTIIHGKKKMEYKKLKYFQGLFKNEIYKLYATDINQDGYLDLALHASSHISKGHHYFYFIYHPKKKVFIQTEEHLPALYSPKKGLLQSRADKTKYRLDKNYKIVLKK